MNEDEFQRVLDWATLIDDSNYYEILSVLEIADPPSIKQAFHAFALAFHPDQHVDSPPEVQVAVRAIFRRGAEGYRVLSDPGLRTKYDLAVAQGHLRLEAGEIPKTSTVGGVQSLEDVAKSPAAKMSARRAEDFLSTGDLRSAKRELKMALHHDEDDNQDLEERIDAIDLAMFAMGD